MALCTFYFIGQYRQENHKEILNQARQKIIAAMNVMPIRVQAPKLNYDNSFIYISAMLLDRSPYEGKIVCHSWLQESFINEKRLFQRNGY